MQIVLTALDDALTKAWQEHCDDMRGITIQQGSILDVACDAVVSPANSFGSWSDAVAQHRALYAKRGKSAKKERLW